MCTFVAPPRSVTCVAKNNQGSAEWRVNLSSMLERGLLLAPLSSIKCSLQSSAYVVDSILGMPRVHHFEHHVITGLEALHHGIKLILGAGRLFVDASDHQAGFETLQVCERP